MSASRSPLVVERDNRFSVEIAPGRLSAKTVPLAMRRCKVERSGLSASASAVGHAKRDTGEGLAHG